MATWNRFVGLAACVVIAACQTPAATSQPTIAAPTATSAIVPPSTSPAPAASSIPSAEPTGVGPFTLTSTAFAEGDSIPRRYTCDGQDTSPALAWAGLPTGTATLAMIMNDPDAGGFVHWVVFDVAANAVDGLPAALPASAPGVPQGRNGFGEVGYGGPCPPGGTHRYVFRLLALDVELGLDGTPTASLVLEAAKGHILRETRLTGTYLSGG